MITRRQLVVGASASGGLLVSGCTEYPLPTGSLLETADSFTYKMQRLLLPDTALVRQFDRDALSKHFPAINDVNPEDEAYHRSRAIGFVDYRLPVTGMVARPASLSLADLKRFPARTQITQHNCVDGWSAIGEWTGVPLWRILAYVGMQPEARFIVFRCVDGWWDSYDLVDALHPQTLLTYGMNGGPLPTPHGGPLRLRVERQLGYKSLKFLTSMHVTDRIGDSPSAKGKGSMAHGYGYNWFAGI